MLFELLCGSSYEPYSGYSLRAPCGGFWGILSYDQAGEMLSTIHLFLPCITDFLCVILICIHGLSGSFAQAFAAAASESAFNFKFAPRAHSPVRTPGGHSGCMFYLPTSSPMGQTRGRQDYFTISHNLGHSETRTELLRHIQRPNFASHHHKSRMSVCKTGYCICIIMMATKGGEPTPAHRWLHVARYL